VAEAMSAREPTGHYLYTADPRVPCGAKHLPSPTQDRVHVSEDHTIRLPTSSRQPLAANYS
jgi:hypothetical protein